VLSLPPDKAAARRVVRTARKQRRASASDTTWGEYGEDLGHGLMSWLDGRPTPKVAATYEALPTEPPTAWVRAGLTALGIRLIVPVLLDDKDLSWRDLQTGEDLGTEGIASAELIVVPALAVARHTGVRLGQGGGSYDRALARHTVGTPVIALLFDDEVVDDVPHDSHDRAVGLVLTPAGQVAAVGDNV
jgi:5-formyltetrahydrofolate cyclo-ligase